MNKSGRVALSVWMSGLGAILVFGCNVAANSAGTQSSENSSSTQSSSFECESGSKGIIKSPDGGGTPTAMSTDKSCQQSANDPCKIELKLNSEICFSAPEDDSMKHALMYTITFPKQTSKSNKKSYYLSFRYITPWPESTRSKSALGSRKAEAQLQCTGDAKPGRLNDLVPFLDMVGAAPDAWINLKIGLPRESPNFIDLTNFKGQQFCYFPEEYSRTGKGWETKMVKIQDIPGAPENGAKDYFVEVKHIKGYRPPEQKK